MRFARRKHKNAGRAKSIALSFLLWFILTGVFVGIDEKFYTDPEIFPMFAVLTPIVCAVFFYYFLSKFFYKNKKYTQSNRFFPSKYSEDQLLRESIRCVYKTNQASASILERNLGISFEEAIQMLSKMEQLGIVSKSDGIHPREILKPENGKNDSVAQNSGIDLIDRMEGHSFEYWCADLLRKIGFTNVEVTPGSGDQGVDVLAEKDGIKYAIQCKCYSKDLGNTPIQEVESGRVYYGCHVGAVMTNRYFTQGAKNLAQKTGTLLWDRDKILEVFYRTSPNINDNKNDMEAYQKNENTQKSVPWEF